MDVLILQQDNVVSTILIGILSRAGHRPLLVEDPFACYEAIQQKDGAAIVLLDKRDDNLDVRSLCQLVRNTKIGYQPYIISLFEMLSFSDIEGILREGVDDVLPLPLNNGLLLEKIKVAERWLQVQLDQRELLNNVQSNAMYNEDLGLFNAKAGKNLITKELSRLRLLANSHSGIEVYPEFFAIKLTNMTQLMDDFGQSCLQDVLEQLSVRIQRHLRGSDISFLMENDIVACFITSYQQRNQLGQELHQACTAEPYVIGNIHFTMVCSVAVIGLDNPPMQLVTEIFSKARELHTHLSTKDAMPVFRFNFKNDKN